jgi:hypothetical protein
MPFLIVSIEISFRRLLVDARGRALWRHRTLIGPPIEPPVVQLSDLLAAVALFGVVPLGIALAYYGYTVGYYPYAGIPFALAGVLVVVFAALFLVLPRLGGSGNGR